MAANVTFSHDGTWAFISPNLAVYPREDGTFSIGKRSGARDYCDVDTGFVNMDAAIDHAEWLIRRHDA
jgi:hypothetical protein